VIEWNANGMRCPCLLEWHVLIRKHYEAMTGVAVASFSMSVGLEMVGQCGLPGSMAAHGKEPTHF
jgi:hypothetical protein